MVVLLLVGISTPASAYTSHAPLSAAAIAALVDKYAARYGIPLSIARNLVLYESGGRQDAVSSIGARGVMQLTPVTARDLGVDINDPEQNIEGGMRYLRQQYNRFGRWDLAVAAYHSGPATVAKYGGVPPASRAHVNRIVGTRVAQAPARSPVLATGFAWPIRGPITARFGRTGRSAHSGIDISAPSGSPIRAARAGTVTFAGWYYDYGRTVIIDHGGGVSTLYGHASALLVQRGQRVRVGDLIARVGCTGRCTGPHAHFEIRVNGRAVDPLRSRALAAAPRTRQTSSKPAPAPQAGPSTLPAAAIAGADPETMRVIVTPSSVLGVTETVRDGVVIRRVEIIVLLDGGQQIWITYVYELVDGVLTRVSEQRTVQAAAVQDDERDEEDH